MRGGYRLIDADAPEDMTAALAPGSKIPRTAVTLRCRNLSYSVKVPAAKEDETWWGRRVEKDLLNELDLAFHPGEIVGLMGPSGAGKTTLLNVLAGHNHHQGTLRGSLTANDGPLPANFKQVTCFIPQDDVLLAGLTPRETLMFTAQLRLRASATARESRVNTIMEQLGLIGCADVLVGNVDRKGISGGQRKRVSIGMELLTDPAVLFVDEATSGLDSKMAEDVISILRNLARDSPGRTVICTIHQPSYGIFVSFDKLVLLANGRTAYFGAVQAAPGYFAGQGLDIPQNENPADVYMRWLQDPTIMPALLLTARRLQNDIEGGSTSIRSQSIWDKERPKQSSSYATSHLWQFWVLFQRTFWDMAKDPEKYLQTLVVKITVGLLVGIVWIDQAGHTQHSIFPTQGVFFMVLINSVMDTVMQTALTFPTSRALLLREYRNGTYALPCFHLAMALANCIFMCINTFVMALPVYFLVGLRLTVRAFCHFVAITSLQACIGVGFGLAIGAIANDFAQAQAMVAPSIIPLILFSGYVIPYDQIKDYFLWLYYASFFQYGFSALQINQFHDWDFNDCDLTKMENTCKELGVDCESLGVMCYETGEDLLHEHNIYVDDMLFDYAIMGATLLFSLALSYYVMRHVIRTQ